MDNSVTDAVNISECIKMSVNVSWSLSATVGSEGHCGQGKEPRLLGVSFVLQGINLCVPVCRCRHCVL